ncbi:MAG: hypothetical protein JSV97_09705 [candidate division WOR-3 bacterium]|nr:MAG: hypothetical protein JSV97_09705 [candidate division WOR-3 bacterium]
MLIALVLLAHSWAVHLDSTLSFIGLTAQDITFRNDYTIADPYRFLLVDSLLKNPLYAVDVIKCIDEGFWDKPDCTVLQNLISLYGFQLPIKKTDFKEGIADAHRLIREAFRETPRELHRVFEELILFSPEPTGSIEEEKEGEKQYDSLVQFLKEQGTAIDYERLFDAGVVLLSALTNYSVWTQQLKHEREEIEGVEGDVVYYEKCLFGEIVIGDTGRNAYTKDFTVIIDYGGDDMYQFGAQTGGIHIIIDKAGDDVYRGENYAIACGHFGISILIDEEGNDTYEAQSFSIGCAVFGIGLLLDREGDDRYTGDTFTEGAGGFGIGIIKDEAGQDRYEGALYAQGFGSTYGIGILGDRDGNERYTIAKKYLDEGRYLDHYLSLSQGFAIGFRPDLSAGIGMILDRNGHDSYLADIFAQGSSYWYGIGALVDGDGNDDYVAYQYAQGSGTHITIGLLVDERGDDNYIAKGVSQGCGHDLSFGLLLDNEGDDSYVAFDLSQGAGNANGVGVLIDECGDDSYSVKRTHNTQGYGDFRREYGSIGVLLDLQGKDIYRSGQDNSLWQKGTYGIGVDWYGTDFSP